MAPRHSSALAALAVAASACENTAQLEFDARPALSADSTGSMTAALVVATPAALPRCQDVLLGTTAYVQQGSLLYTCARGAWTRETCSVDRAGEVAFVSGQGFLLACSGRAWVRVELPSGAAGPSGRDALVASSAEPAGAHCANGGVRIDSGVDANASGILEAGEVSSSSYACNGAAGGEAASILSVTRPAQLAECRAGGQVVTLFRDLDGDQTLDAGEALGSPVVVCNGDAAIANGPNPVVKVYRGANQLGVVAGEGSAGTAKVLSATITAPGTGSVLVLGSSMAYCSAPSTPPDQSAGHCASPAGTTYAWLTIVDAASQGQAGNSGEAIPNSGLQNDTDTQLSVMATFNVSAGTYSYDLLGMAGEYTPDPTATSVYYGASELTVIFIPHT